MAPLFDRRNIDWILACPLMARTRRGARELQAAVAALKAERAGVLTLDAEEPGAVLLGGCDEQALEAQVTWIRERMTEALDLGALGVGYREAIGQAAVVEHRRHDRVGGPRHLMLAVEPRGFHKGRSYETRIAVSGLSDETRRTIEAGVIKGLDRGPVAHYPVIAVSVTVLALDLGDPAAGGPVLEEALRVALRDALWQAGARLVEPIMALQVTTPDDFLDRVTRDLSTRRAEVTATLPQPDADTTRISALVPFANLFGYVNSLRSLTQGRASYTLRFSHYAQVPGSPPDDPPPEAAAGALRW